MKQLLFLLLLITSAAHAQLSENNVPGKWTVTEVVLIENNPGTKEVYEGFKGSSFTFSADHKVTFSTPSTSKTFGLIARKLASNNWLLDGKLIRIGSKSDNYTTMVIDVSVSGRDTWFMVEETPVKLKMVKG